jgi:predicted adenylyl cyclase CyaB
MPSNIEIKASLSDPARVRILVEQVGEKKGIMFQEDTFFKIPKGRLKLRRFSSTEGELIYYERRDSPGPRQSDYLKVTTEEPDGLRQILEKAIGLDGVVRKRRELYLIGQTRIHLDEVEGLGNFLELEVVLQEGQKAEEGMVIVAELMEKLGIKKEDLIAEAYVDLIKKENLGQQPK